MQHNWRTAQGNHSEQSLTVLARETQYGSTDNWDEYKEFSVQNNQYTGIFSYPLPSNYRAEDIVSLTLVSNYQGALKVDQSWQWHIFNYKNNTWQLLGDNTEAADWQWTHLEFPIVAASGSESVLTASVNDYVNQAQQFRIRYRSVGQDSTDSSLLDLLSYTFKSKIQS